MRNLLFNRPVLQWFGLSKSHSLNWLIKFQFQIWIQSLVLVPEGSGTHSKTINKFIKSELESNAWVGWPNSNFKYESKASTMFQRVLERIRKLAAKSSNPWNRLGWMTSIQSESSRLASISKQLEKRRSRTVPKCYRNHVTFKMNRIRLNRKCNRRYMGNERKRIR